MRKLEELQVTGALGTTLHFCCTRGPDLGAVVPVRGDTRLGRHLGLCDPFTEQVHLQLAPSGKNVVCKDVGVTNRVKAFRRVFRMRPGRTVRVGTNRWTLRVRAGRSHWKEAELDKKSRRLLGTLRFVMPVVILGSMSRFFLPAGLFPFLLAGIGSVGGGLWVWSLYRRRVESDPGSLLLEVAARVKSDRAPTEPERDAETEFSYYLRPRRRRTGTASPGSFAVVGPGAEAYALWVRAQVFVSSGQAPRAWWARSVEDLPEVPTQVLSSHVVPGALWEAEMSTLLEAAKPPGEKLAESVDLEKTLGSPTSELIRSLWKRSKADPESAWAVPLGVEGDSEPTTLLFDLVADGPHALVVGGTGSGKSEFLTSLVIALAASVPPEDLRFVFIDYKGGAGLSHLEGLPHVELSLTDLEGAQTPWLLRALRAEMQRRKETLRQAGFRSLAEWRQEHLVGQPRGPAPPPALVVVADEVALLAQASPELLEQLGQIGTQGRSLGLHLVLASQRAGGVITPNLRAVLDLRIALRCAEERDSIDSIGDASAARLPRIPGRAILQRDGRRTQVQAAHATQAQSWVAAIRKAQYARPGSDGQEVKRVFSRPLPETCGPFTASPPDPSAAGQVGLYEHPVTADLEPLVWDGRPLLLIGPSRPELNDLASRITSGLPGEAVWVGVSTGTQVPSAGDSLFLLEETLQAARAQDRARPPVVVVLELSALLEQMGTLAGITASQGLLRDLTDLGERGTIRLICTDTSPTSGAKNFPWHVFHLPSPDLLSRPDFLTWLPRAQTAQHGYVSSIPGRVVVVSPDLHGVHAQLSRTRKTREVSRGPSPTSDQVSPGADLLRRAARSPDAQLVVVSDDPEDVELVQAQCAPGNTFQTAKHLDLSEWPQIPQGHGTVVVAVEPSRETVRMISSTVSGAPLWPIASIPFPPRSGIVRFGTRISPLELPPKVPDRPFCDRSHVKS